MRRFMNKMKQNFIENAYFIRKRIFFILFTGFILIFSFYNAYTKKVEIQNAFYECIAGIRENPKDIRTQISQFETNLEDNFSDRMKFVELFGFVQKALDKKEINNFSYIKDNTGSLHYASFYREEETDCFEYAMRIKRLKDYVSQFDTDVLFVVAPSKYVASDSRFPKDMPVNDPEVVVDETLFYLNRLGVDTLDLNLYLPNEEIPYEEAFFKTDHHWTIPSAFYATGILADYLNEHYHYGLETNKYLDKEQFDVKVYRQGMLGSMGRATGYYYSGMDDMTALFPKFHMDIERTFMEEDGNYQVKKGDLTETVIMPELLKKEDIYSDSQYSVYLNGLRYYECIKNNSNPDGKKMLMIRDSYFSPVISFMIPMCGQIDAIWSLEEMEELDIEQYIRDNRFDCIIIEMYPYNIGDDAFQFFKDENNGED